MRDTICAVSTANGEGGIAIVRLSGSRALEIFEKAFVPLKKRPTVSHTMVFGHAVDADGAYIDEAMGVFFAAPATYTREDVCEIQCHGGGVCARRVLARLLELGARAAEPGEFTRRAFLNGRIDLARAEAVMSLIGANSEAAARASVRQLEGGVSAFAKNCAERLENLLSLLAACTDFPDEVEESDAADTVRAECADLIALLQKNCDRRSARLIREGARIVLAGRPNVGKSSVMNALLGSERAIVTEIAGTTRDVLTERIRLGGVIAEISDTAGQRLTEDPVEKIGVRRAEQAMETADVRVIVLDGSQPLTDEDGRLLKTADARTVICVNKRDLEPAFPLSDVTGVICDMNDPASTLADAIVAKSGKNDPTFTLQNAVCVSCKTGEGIGDLLGILENRVKSECSEDNLLVSERHIALAERAARSLESAVHAIDAGLALDVTELDLRQALGALCEITGENASEEVIDRVFKNFCVGK